MFEQTAWGYKATDETIAFWNSRDTCPACGAICEPEATRDGLHHYAHKCEGNAARWTRKA